MSLSAKDKATVKKFWEKAEAKSGDIGAEALGRTLVVFPQTKTYFSHWGSDLNAQTPQVRKHGGVILEALGKIIKKIDNILCAVGPLSELHAYKLSVDPANFKILSHNIILVLAAYFPADFTPEVHVSFDKFLQNVALGLSEKYR